MGKLNEFERKIIKFSRKRDDIFSYTGIIIDDINNKLPDKLHYMISHLREIKESTKHIDYQCDFDKNGGCKTYRDKSDPQCCCIGCNGSAGYFDYRDIILLSRIKIYKRHFLSKEIKIKGSEFPIKRGFWRQGKGCILNRSDRSFTCIYHHCHLDDNSTLYTLISSIEYRYHCILKKIKNYLQENMDYIYTKE